MPPDRPPPLGSRVKAGLRDLLRGSLLALCRLRSRPYIPDTEPVLVIAPHQDDCTLGCGGLIFQKRLAGHPVEILYLTDGAVSHPGHPFLTPAEISLRRKAEARLANQRLGVDSAALRFLDLPDSRLDKLATDERAAAVTRLAAALAERAPSVLLLPLRHDGSSEHQAGFTLVRDALERASLRPRVLEYAVWSLWSPQLLLPALRRARIHRFDFPGYAPRKSHALAAYVSQFEPTPPWKNPVLPAGFRSIFETEREFFFEYQP
jgi:N-acetylglucosamine malate deacetylase 1